MSAVLNEAETKFFSSKGAEVDASLRPAEPTTADPAPTSTPPPAAAAPATVTPPPAEPVTPQVPLAALHEERKARQQAEADRKALQAQLQQFQSALDEYKKGQQPAPPDPNQDPIGAMIHQNKLLQAELDQLKSWRSENDQVTQQITARQQFHQAVTNSENAFRQTHPDYDQALNHAMQQYDKLLSLAIPDATERRQRVIQEGMNMAWTLLQQGRDPAAFFYDFAKQYGYGQPVPPAIPALPGAPPATAPVAPAIPATVPEVVQTIERGLKQQGNPGGGGGPIGEVTPEMALKLSGDEFNKWWAKQFRR